MIDFEILAIHFFHAGTQHLIVFFYDLFLKPLSYGSTTVRDVLGVSKVRSSRAKIPRGQPLIGGECLSRDSWIYSQ